MCKGEPSSYNVDLVHVDLVVRPETNLLQERCSFSSILRWTVVPIEEDHLSTERAAIHVEGSDQVVALGSPTVWREPPLGAESSPPRWTQEAASLSC